MKSISLITISSLLLSIGAFSQGEGVYKAAELCATSPNSVGKGVVLTMEGGARQCPEYAILTGGPADLCGALVYGPIAANPPLPWGEGRLCIAPFHPCNGRYNVCAFTSGGEVRIELNGGYAYPQYPFRPGEMGHFQFLYRDGGTWNLSNALTVVVAP